MVKEIIKEFFIVLLLCAAILLILGVIFYDYIPDKKVVPNKVAYSVPNEVKGELEEANLESSAPKVQDMVYTIEGADLDAYIRSKTYNPSKQNPYANTTSGATTTTNSGTTGESASNGNSKSSNGSTRVNTSNTNNNSDDTPIDVLK